MGTKHAWGTGPQCFLVAGLRARGSRPALKVIATSAGCSQCNHCLRLHDRANAGVAALPSAGTRRRHAWHPRRVLRPTHTHTRTQAHRPIHTRACTHRPTHTHRRRHHHRRHHHHHQPPPTACAVRARNFSAPWYPDLFCFPPSDTPNPTFSFFLRGLVDLCPVSPPTLPRAVRC